MDGNHKYTYEDLLDIIKTLRSENGCPWDREQTHMSLRPCLMEEAAEVLAAIRVYDQSGDYENLREELGDVLLQVVMHAQIAEEEGIFTMADVTAEVAEKMVRRHPHVFGDIVVSNSGEVLENWEDIKKREKEGKQHPQSPLREIPQELPALTRACKVLKKANKVYEPGRDYEKAVSDLGETVKRLAQCQPADYEEQITAQVGEALMAIADISRICKLSLEQILTDKIDDFIERYEGENK